MPWKRMGVDDQRMQFVIRAVSGKERMAVLCREFGISRPTGYLWRRRYLETRSVCDLAEHSRRPQRVARSTPNELWQMDTKGKYRLEDGQCHALCMVDDHSRYAVGVYALPVLTMEQAHPCIVNSFRSHGLPLAMLMDHGALWWATSNGWGLTWLSVRLIEQGIRLVYGRVSHPQTQGKVERLHRTLGEAMRHRGVPRYFSAWPGAVAEFQSTYNNRRPHEAIDMQRPREIYQASPRRYQEQPPAWEYPEGSDVRRVNVNGAIEGAGRKWFVCEALAGQHLRVERFDGKLLVSYRHMYIREINLEGGTTQALVRARSAATSEPAPAALRATSAGSEDHKIEEKANH